MKSPNKIFAGCAVIIAVFTSGSTAYAQAPPAIQPYTPESKELYDTIVRMDSIWEDSYNHCKLDIQDQLISEDLEFYHDRGGLMTSKVQLANAMKNNICGKVNRQLLKGSIEVYPIHDYGAVEMGYHGFHGINEKETTHFARFIHIWKRENGRWRITRVISLH